MNTETSKPLNSDRIRVVVTGYGMVTPLGPTAEETFRRAARGESGVDYLSVFETQNLPTQIGGQVQDQWLEEIKGEADPLFGRLASRGLLLLVASIKEAIAQAQLNQVVERRAMGVVVGSHGENPDTEDILFFQRFSNGQGKWDLKRLYQTGGYDFLHFYRRKPDVAATLAASYLGAEGPILSLVSACAAGSQAIGEAYRLIQEGRCRLALAGGCEASLRFSGFLGFSLIKAMAEKYSSPQTASRPFDRKRNGFVMSEGGGALVLEDLAHAQSRGVPILGEILGYGDSADAYRITDTHPKGEGAILAMRMALNDAGITPEQVEYINAHGTSTTLNDITETKAVKEVFGERALTIPISANKSMLGHTIGAAGAIESILTLIGIQQGLILPTINYQFPDPKCDLDYVPNEARKQPHRIAISNSFGFGGQNSCVCLGRFDG